MDIATKHSCRNCRYYHKYKDIESWEMPHIFWWVHQCNARQGIENLKQFPFLTMRYGFSCGTGTPKRYGETY